MSKSSNDKPQPHDGQTDTPPRSQTVQMNPAMLGQAANMNPGSEAVKHLDAAAQLLEDAVDSNESAAADPTIEEYMAALLARSRDPSAVTQSMASTVPAPAASPAQTSPTAERSAAATTPDELNPDATTEPQAAAPRTPVAAPECRDAISELRELANISARSSFNVHQGRQLVYELHNKLAVCLVSLVVSFALTSLATSTRSPAFFAAVAATVVAIYWTTRYFRLAKQLRRLCFFGRTEE